MIIDQRLDVSKNIRISLSGSSSHRIDSLVRLVDDAIIYRRRLRMEHKRNRQKTLSDLSTAPRFDDADRLVGWPASWPQIAFEP